MIFQNRRIPALVYTISLALFACTFTAPPIALANEPVANWSLLDASGENINFYDDAQGRPAVLLFWATWCPYCRALMPYLESLRQEFSDRGVRFYALNIWEDADPIAYMREKNFGFRLMLEADDVAKEYGIKGTPGLIAVDARRKIIYQRRSGTSPEQVETELMNALENLLK
jgi:cytochrome c biogenesis protein CcmG/thiol:disulfide interchange protein DsbE